jgi:hypothetical protein
VSIFLGFWNATTVATHSLAGTARHGMREHDVS